MTLRGFAAAALCACSSAVAQDSTYRVVATSGQAANGTSARFAAFDPESLRLNENGEVVFIATLEGEGVAESNDTGVFVTEGGTPGLIAREGDQGDGVDFGLFYDFFNPLTPQLNNNGELTIFARLGGAELDFTEDWMILSNRGDAGGPLRKIARESDAAPGMPLGVRYSTLNPASFNDRGDMVFFASLVGTGIDVTNGLAVFGDIGGAGIGPIARQTEQAPGLPSGVLYDGFINVGSFPQLNESGSIAFQFKLSGEGVDSSNDLANFAGPADALLPVARTGDPIPGAPPLPNDEIPFFASLESARLNDAGATAMLGRAGASTVTLAPIDRLYSDAATGSLARVDLRSDPTRDPTPISWFGMNGSGDVAAIATVGSGFVPGEGFVATDALVLAPAQGSSRTVVVEGEPAPAAEGVGDVSVLLAAHINATDRIAFAGAIRPRDGRDEIDAVWISGADGSSLLALAGDTLPNGATITGISIAADPDNESPLEFNNAGEVAFVVELSDGSQAIVVASLDEGPTPCNAADLAEPFGLLSARDVLAFIRGFFRNDPAVAAIAEPTDRVGLRDVLGFLDAYFSGCPAE